MNLFEVVKNTPGDTRTNNNPTPMNAATAQVGTWDTLGTDNVQGYTDAKTNNWECNLNTDFTYTTL